jgi:hypothetical protein
MKIVATPRVVAFPLAIAAALALAGCQPPPVGQGPAGKTGAHDHDHDHAHHGPHGGHIMEIGEEEYHAEWTHDESGKVTFYLLDSDVKKEVPIAADEISIDVKIGDHAPVTYKLAAVNPQDGKSATFEIVDKNLLGVLETLKDNKGTVCTLHVTIDGKTFAQKIEEHDHGH